MEQHLQGIYYDPAHPAGFSGKTRLLEATKGKFNYKEVNNWLQSQDTYTLHKPVRKRFPRNRGM
jgi:hypothetical protein